MVVFKMRDIVPSTRYSSVCNVLRQWHIPLRDIQAFVMYCVNGTSRSSLLIESIDSMLYRTYGLLVPGGALRKCATRKRI